MQNRRQLAVSAAQGRITEVWSDSAGGSFGSGYLLGGGLILTARHVLMSEASTPPTVIKARPLGIAHLVEGLQPVDLVWPELAILADAEAPDAALLQLPGFEYADPGPPLGPPDENGTGRGTLVSATGFPAFVPEVAGRRDTEEITGIIHLGTTLVAGRYQIQDMTVRDRKLKQELDWRGMSGAALLANGRVIGVLIARKTADQRYDFSAVRIETLLMIPAFLDAIRGHAPVDGDRTRTLPQRRFGDLATQKAEALAVQRPRYQVEGLSPPFDIRWLKSSFVDRREYLYSAANKPSLPDRLKENSVRLVCVWGRPGTGRTRLVQRFVVDSVTPALPLFSGDAPLPIEGVAYIPARNRLGKAKDPDMLFDELYLGCAKLIENEGDRDDLEALPKSYAASEKKIRTLISALRERRFILAIDDIDEILDERNEIDAAHVDLRTLLEALQTDTNGIQMLVTSERPLKQAPDLMQLQETVHLGPLPEGAAVAYLCALDERFRRLKEESPDDLKHIVHDVTHGLPKALGILYSIILDDPLLEMRDLTRHFYSEEKVVSELSADRLARLDEPSKRLTAALSVFQHPVPIEAVCRLLEPDSSAEATRTRVRHLIRSGVLEYDGSTKRISLDPVDHDIYYAQLPIGEIGFARRALHRRAAEYYRSDSARVSPDKWQTRDDANSWIFEFEQYELADDYDKAVAVLDKIDYSWRNHQKFLAYMLMWGRGHEVIAFRERLIGKLLPQLEARNLAALEWVCKRIDPARAKRQNYLDAAIKIAVKSGDLVGQMFALTEHGFFLNDREAQVNEARKTLHKVLDLAKQTGERYWEGMAKFGLAYTEFDQDNDYVAIDHAEGARQIFEEVGRPLRVIDALIRLGMIHRKLKMHSEALDDAMKAMKCAEDIPSIHWQAEAHSAYGFHYRGKGNIQKALQEHEKALELYSGPAYSLREQAVQRSYCGALRLELGLSDAALDDYAAALHSALDMQLLRELGWILSGVGMTIRRLGCRAEALPLQETALKIVEGLEDPRSQVIRLTDLAATKLILGAEGVMGAKGAIALVAEALNLASRMKQISPAAVLPASYVQAAYITDILPHEMQAPGDHLRRGLILVHAMLQLREEKIALALVEAARNPLFDVPNLGHRAALLHGLTLHRLGDAAAAGTCYAEAIKAAQERMLEDGRLYDAAFTLAVAQAGQGAYEAAEATLNAMKPILGFRGLYEELVCLAIELPHDGGDFTKKVLELQPKVPTPEDCKRLTAKLGDALTRLPHFT